MKHYVVEQDGFIVGVLSKEQVDVINNIDTKGITIHEIHSTFSDYIDSIPFGVYRFTYNILTKKIESTEVDEINIKISNLGVYRKDEHQIIYEDTHEHGYKLDEFLSICKEIESDSTNIEYILEKNSIDYFPVSYELKDNHPERTLKDLQKSEKLFRQILKSLEKKYGNT